MPKRYFVNGFVGKESLHEVIDKTFVTGRIKEVVDQIIARQKLGRRDLDGGLYVGAGGVAYMLLHIQKQFPNQSYLETAKRLAVAHLTSCQTRGPESLGFLLGGSGIFALNAVLSKTFGDTESQNNSVKLFKNCLHEFLKPDPLGCGSDEMLVGRAGYLAGYMWLCSQGVNSLSLPEVYSVCDMMVRCGQEYSVRSRSPCPLMYQYYGTEYLGAAHGLVGILQMLLTIPGYLQHCSESAARDIRASVDYMLQIQTPDGNFPCAMDELAPGSRPPEDDLVHWCHGAPGTVYLLARAYLVWGDQKYLLALKKAADICWEKGLLKKGPGICHGVAGTGYVFLLLYRVTKEKLYLTRANCCAKFLFTEEFAKGARYPDCPLSLYEGWSGTVCFLTDLLDPDSASFPFSDVFI